MSEIHPKPLVAGNWKMNGDLALVETFVSGLQNNNDIDIVICPPALYVKDMQASSSFEVGVQNCSEFVSGAHTGELSASMLVDLQVKHVILGHSERREKHFEDDYCIARKVKTALEIGLTPIICVGEPLDVREAGQVFEFIKDQLDAVMDECGPSFIANSIIAYEPIWAIGTGQTASPEQAQEVHEFIRKQLAQWDHVSALKIRILYGGSVNAKNAKELFAKPDINGGLIGGASLNVSDFNLICQAASE